MTESPAHSGFDEWFRAAWPDLTRSLTLTFRGNSELAAEAAAEACSVALAKWGEVGEFANPTGWAYTVALRAGRRIQRRSVLDRRLREKISATARGAADPPPAWVEIAEIIGDLPSRQRDVVVLRYVLQMTQRDIADVLGLAPGSVAASLNQARTRLRALLDPNPFDPSTNDEETTHAR